MVLPRVQFVGAGDAAFGELFNASHFINSLKAVGIQASPQHVVNCKTPTSSYEGSKSSIADLE